MNQVTFSLTINGKTYTWTVLQFSWGAYQLENTTGSHGNPRNKRLKVALQYDNDENARNVLYNLAFSKKKKIEIKLEFHEGGQNVRTITFKNAEFLDFLEEGEFLLDGTGAGINQMIECIVPEIEL